MKKINLKFVLKNVIVLASFSLLGFLSVYLPSIVMAEPLGSNAYENPDFPFAIVKSSYHDAMNEFFNSKLEILSEILEDENFYEDERFIVPDGVNTENYKENCPEDNVSTFCISMQALEIYDTYIQTLNLMKDKLISREERGDEINIEGILQLTSSRNTNISDEIIEAEKALMMTVSAYNEYRIAYPMHIENQKIIKSLIKYRRELMWVRRWVELFPSRFVDATSAYCK
jgi:hypothetical protein